jgi:hypothetical protein
MFDTPSPPGLDAVYVNALKEEAGEEEEEEEEDYEEKCRKRPRNPFINDECSVGDDEVEDDFERKFARGELVDEAGRVLEPVTLARPPPAKRPALSSFPPGGAARRRAAATAKDEATVRIDEFLAQRRAQLKSREPAGDDVRLAGSQESGASEPGASQPAAGRQVAFNVLNLWCRLHEREAGLVVGPVEGGWAVRQAGGLALVATGRLQETALYTRLLDTHPDREPAWLAAEAGRAAREMPAAGRPGVEEMLRLCGERGVTQCPHGRTLLAPIHSADSDRVSGSVVQEERLNL